MYCTYFTTWYVIQIPTYLSTYLHRNKLGRQFLVHCIICKIVLKHFWRNSLLSQTNSSVPRKLRQCTWENEIHQNWVMNLTVCKGRFNVNRFTKKFKQIHLSKSFLGVFFAIQVLSSCATHNKYRTVDKDLGKNRSSPLIL